jgi:hypothetical protein
LAVILDYFARRNPRRVVAKLASRQPWMTSSLKLQRLQYDGVYGEKLAALGAFRTISMGDFIFQLSPYFLAVDDKGISRVGPPITAAP